MASVSAGRRDNFDVLQNGIFNLYVDDNLDLFERQAASIMKIFDVPRNDYSYASGYFHLCTAFGKSYLIKAMAMSYSAMQSGKKIIVLEENQSVVKQMARELTQNSSLRSSDVGMFFAESKDVDTPIIVCTYASMKKMIERVGRENIGLVLCDEAHHILSDNRQNVAREFADCALYGFTATSDYGIQDKNCATVFGPVIDSVTIRDGIERDGLLCSTKTGLFLSNIPVDLTRAIVSGHEDYDPNILDELLRASHVDGLRRGLADWYLYGVDDTIGTVFGKQTIINVPSISEAEHVAREFNTAAAEKGLAPIAHAYHTKTSDAVLDEFNAGHFPVLIQVNKISEGYNNPNVAICINYPTHSMVRSIQRSGRALRFNPNDPNKCALVMDIAFARRAPDEGEIDVLSAIYENGQRLFYDVLGTVQCMNPADKRTSGDGKQSENPRPRESVALPSVFRVVTSVEFTNMILEHRTNNPDVGEKTDEWLGTIELRKKYIIASPTKILECLRRYKNIMPEYIQEKHNFSRYALYLRRDAIEYFCKVSGLQYKDGNIGKKTENWLSAGDLSGKYIVGNSKKILTMLEKYQDKEYIQKKNASGNISLYLRRDAINQFCTLAGLRRTDAGIGIKTDDWLGASDLSGTYLVGDPTKILATLKKHQDKEYIQEKKSGTNIVLCLRYDVLDEFSKMSGLKRLSSDIGIKTDDWLGAEELAGRYLVGMSTKILKFLKQYQKIIPEYIQEKRNKSRIALYLRRDAIDKFCEVSGIKCVDSVDKKTDDWLAANDLSGKYIVGSQQKILSLLGQYQNVLPDDIQYKRNASKIPLCLRVDAVKRFCKLTGVMHIDDYVGRKTDDWLGTRDLSGKYIVGDRKKISELLKKYQHVMPEHIQKKHSGSHVTLYLRRDAIDVFCKISGLKQKNDIVTVFKKNKDNLSNIQTNSTKQQNNR